MSKFKKFLPMGTYCAVFVTLCSILAYTPVSSSSGVPLQNAVAVASSGDIKTSSDIDPTTQAVPNQAEIYRNSVLASRSEEDLFSEIEDDSIIAAINDNNVNVRNYPDTEHAVVKQLSKDDTVTVLTKYKDWFKVQVSNDIIGWVNKKLLDFNDTKEYESANSLVASIPIEKPDYIAPVISKGQQIVAYAKKFLGVRYVWGGTTPRGFDCSGFVKYVYSHFGVGLNRVASDQATQGYKVSRSNLKPGDLVFFDTNGGRNDISHVGIYIGNGNFIEASSSYSHHKIIVADMDSGSYAHQFMTARRIFK
ncbi:MAG: SH3 domain-containing C40 family peptidase [Bacillota bacterium]|nr:SH3 domain-containing C40 family peptidase [Bacillota bacterium]